MGLSKHPNNGRRNLPSFCYLLDSKDPSLSHPSPKNSLKDLGAFKFILGTEVPQTIDDLFLK
ncbi:hypothetical protein EPI10_022195 [Gossypium australe]|uniref:Uncharacterized protein n=1 Tax=Gossypium australe TaxID=47621 RepID=A0A5B6WL00_9ROSI|nr:hypothetical protein EPI10_022195 [Gossypium australe]